MKKKISRESGAKAYTLLWMGMLEWIFIISKRMHKNINYNSSHSIVKSPWKWLKKEDIIESKSKEKFLLKSPSLHIFKEKILLECTTFLAETSLWINNLTTNLSNLQLSRLIPNVRNQLSHTKIFNNIEYISFC